MQHPEKFKHPCNCFGTLGQFEGDVEFHEMGMVGCRNDPNKLRETTDYSWLVFVVGFILGAATMYSVL